MTSSWAHRLLPPLNRRQALRQVAGAATAAVGLASLRPPGSPHAGPGATGAAADRLAALQPVIHPRSAWAGARGVKGPIVPETDVRVLLVHHTASTNDYTPAQVPAQIQGFYDYHTGPSKGWPDVAYNFFVDRFGGIWEGRQGSLAGAVRGDATGGSQGFSQLCSLIGNYQEAPVAAEQQASLTRLLAWLGERYGVDTTPGATVSFVSRGSNRWPAGARVTAATISGHRDMSLTSCPGDHAYDLVSKILPTGASALRTAVPGTPNVATPAPVAPGADDPAPTTTATTPVTADGADGADDEAAPPTAATLGSTTGDTSADALGPVGRPPAGGLNPVAVVGGVGAAAAVGLSALAVDRRRRSARLSPAGLGDGFQVIDTPDAPRPHPAPSPGPPRPAGDARPAWLAATDALQPSSPRLGSDGTSGLTSSEPDAAPGPAGPTGERPPADGTP